MILAAVTHSPVILDQAALPVMVARSLAAMVGLEAAPTVAPMEAHMAALTGVAMVPNLMDLHTEVMEAPTIATTPTRSPDLLSDSIQLAMQPPLSAIWDISMADSGVMAPTLETSGPALATWAEA